MQGWDVAPKCQELSQELTCRWQETNYLFVAAASQDRHWWDYGFRSEVGCRYLNCYAKCQLPKVSLSTTESEVW